MNTEIRRHKKAYSNYEHLETFSAGIALTGAEVKSVKLNLINLDGSYVRIRGGEAWLIGAHIPLYPKASAASAKSYNPDRTRKLLLTKKELLYLIGKSNAAGLTIVPLSVYSLRRLIKIRIALARGKRKFDKRAAIKERDFRRQLNARVR